MFIFHPMVSVTVFIVSRGSHWPDAYFSMCDIKSLSLIYTINEYIDAKFPNQTTGTADKFAFRERENR